MPKRTFKRASLSGARTVIGAALGLALLSASLPLSAMAQDEAYVGGILAAVGLAGT